MSCDEVSHHVMNESCDHPLSMFLSKKLAFLKNLNFDKKPWSIARSFCQNLALKKKTPLKWSVSVN